MKDRFWTYVALACVSAVLFIAGLSARLLGGAPATNALVAQELAAAPPFADYAQPPAVQATSPYLYRESLPFSFEDISWEAQTEWRSSERAFEGEYALKITYQQPWSGAGLFGGPLATKGYAALAFALYTAHPIPRLYLELYDDTGRTLGQVSWRLSAQNRWQRVAIPLSRFGSPEKIGGFAIVSSAPAVAYLDDMRLE